MKQLSTPVLPAQGPADPMLKALCTVPTFAVSRPYVLTVKALRGLQTYHPYHTPPPGSTSGAHQKTQVLSQLRKRSSSWEFRKGGGGRKQKTAFQACFRLSEVEAKAGCGRKSGFFFLSPLHLALNVSSGFPHPSCLCLRRISHLCPSSLKLYCSSPREVIIAHYSK